MDAPQVNEKLEYLKIGFAFAGTLIGALIGAPLIEQFKARLGAREAWKAQSHEIVGTLRLIMGIVGAFDELRREAFGATDEVPRISMPALSRLRQFDFAQFDANVGKLAVLHPNDSKRSAVAQRLVQHLLVLRSHFRQLQTLEPITGVDLAQRSKFLGLSEMDTETLRRHDKRRVDLGRFLIGIYATRLGIQPMSLMIDTEIFQFEDAMSRYDLEESRRELAEQIAKFKHQAADRGDAQ